MDIEVLIDRATLLDLVHDKYFDLSAAHFAKDKQEFQLFLGDNRRGTHKDKLLGITNVFDVLVQDEAGIETYDLWDVELSTGSIRITTGADLEIVLTVGEQCKIYVTDLRDLNWRSG